MFNEEELNNLNIEEEKKQPNDDLRRSLSEDFERDNPMERRNQRKRRYKKSKKQLETFGEFLP